MIVIDSLFHELRITIGRKSMNVQETWLASSLGVFCKKKVQNIEA
jgi:hypothetical protein